MTQEPHPDNPVAVPLPPQVIKPVLREVYTREHRVLAGNFHYFTFHTEIPLHFKPGQYMSVKVSPARVNCYSIAGSDDPNSFNLFVNTAPGGPGSKFFENLKVGEPMTCIGPLGIFGLHLEDGAESLVFGATGSGIAPLICMIKDLLYIQKYVKPIHLYLGLTYPYEVYWKDVFTEMSTNYPNFKCTYVVFKPDEHWTGPTGFITQQIAQDNLDAHGVSAYLCGHPNMIADVSRVLIEQGCIKDHIYTEKY